MARAQSIAKHTPGPWRVFTAKPPNDHKIIGIGELTGEGIADCGFGVWRGGSAEALANARLIAAAPELLAALKAARRYVETCADPFNKDDHVLKQVDAAIARATGAA